MVLKVRGVKDDNRAGTNQQAFSNIRIVRRVACERNVIIIRSWESTRLVCLCLIFPIKLG